MPVSHTLKWFRPSEFKRPHLVNETAVFYLDHIRDLFGKPIIITDDARVRGEALPPGASGRSLHFLGQAFDIRIRHWLPEDLWRFVWVVQALRLPPERRGIELELVWSDRDKHAHVGFFLDGRPDRLLIRGD